MSEVEKRVIYSDAERAERMEQARVQNVRYSIPLSEDESRIQQEFDEAFSSVNENMKKLFEAKYLLVFGEFGGHFAHDQDYGRSSWAVKEEFDQVFPYVIGESDDIEIWEENGKLFIESENYAGSNKFEIRVLTDEGKRQYDEFWEGDPDTPSDEAFSVGKERLLNLLVNTSDEYYSELPRYLDETEVIYIAESGEEYTRADFERIADETLSELSTAKPEEYQRIMHGIIPQASDILRDQLISLADWQSVETLADEFLNDPEVHFPPEDEWTAEDWKALVEKSYQEESQSLLSTVYTKEDIASFKASFKEKAEKPREGTSLAQVAQESRDAAHGLRNDGDRQVPNVSQER